MPARSFLVLEYNPATNRDRRESVSCRESRMPEIARFYGIIIRMFVESGAAHNRPHFHAYYQNSAAVYALDTIELIEGGLPRRRQRLVEIWAEMHRGELLENWHLLQEGEPAFKIEPLA
jgi:hypothetical protein